MRRERVITMSPQGLTWLALLEGGYRLDAYKDQAGVWTISAGCTYYSLGVRVKKGDRLKDVEAAELLFRQRLAEFEGYVDAATRDDLTPTEFDALVSFCFNIGPGEFRTCTAVKRFNQRTSSRSVAEAMGWYHNITNPATGKLVFNEGVMERRRCEAYLLMYGIYKTQRQPKPEPPV